MKTNERFIPKEELLNLDPVAGSGSGLIINYRRWHQIRRRGILRNPPFKDDVCEDVGCICRKQEYRC